METKMSASSKVVVLPEHVLKDWFQMFCPLSKFTGFCPIQINSNGFAKFHYFAPPCIFTLIMFIFFSGCTFYFTPTFFLVIINRLGSNLTDDIAAFVFGMGQYLSAVGGLLLIPYVSPRFTKVWNHMHKILQVLQIQKDFPNSYRRKRIFHKCQAVSILGVCVVYGYVCYVYYASETDGYFVHSGDDSAPWYFSPSSAFVLFCGTYGLHTIYLLGFFQYSSLIHLCFKSLVSKSQELKLMSDPCAFVKDKFKIDKLEELLDLYIQLNVGVKKLGTLYGSYFVIQTCAMMASFIPAVYYLISFAHNTHHVICSILIILGYTYFINEICRNGEMLSTKSIKCRRSIITAVGLDSAMGGYLRVRELSMEPAFVTALNYFRIDRSLVTSVVGSITTYIIILMQFKFTNSNKTNCEGPTESSNPTVLPVITE